MAGFYVLTGDPRAAPAELVEAWIALEDRALEPNVYLSPRYVLPALRWIDPDVAATAFQVWGRGLDAGKDRLCGMLVATPCAGSRSFPLPHLLGYRSVHSYLSGVLLDEQFAEPALDALLAHVRRRWHGLRFERTWADGPQAELLRSRSLGYVVWERGRRAVVRPPLDRLRLEAALAQQSANLSKKLRKAGDVTWSIVNRGDDVARAAETFLDLEHTGWKAAQGSSLRSSIGGQEFFRAVAKGLGDEGRVVFVQLAVDGQVIASSSNFLSRSAAFAFKIGWKEEHAKLSPGIQVELHLLEQTYEHDALRGLELWDSGAEEGSYLDRLWPSRRVVGWQAVGTTRLARAVLGVVEIARTIKREKRAARAASAPRATE